MKLLYITNGICGVGGLERVLSIKTSFLTDIYKHDITVFSLNEKDKQAFYTFNRKVKRFHADVNINSVLYLLQYIIKIREAVKRINPDIILVCDDGLKGLFLPMILGKPCPMIYERHVSKLISLNGREEKLLDKFVFTLMKTCGKLFDSFVVLTEGNKAEWKGLKNIKVIPNPLSFFPFEVSSLSSKKIIAVGKVSYQKGYERLLKAWKPICEKHPEWSLHIYGDTFDNGALDQQISDQKIDRFEIHPATKNIENVYSDASVLAFPSRYEGFGMVLTEAMSYGIPCVSFDCPHGPSDIIRHNEDGFLVANNDISDFAQKLSILMEDKALRKRMGKNARINVKRFIPEVVMNQWEELFKSLTVFK